MNEVEVAVVGGGIAGTAATYYLARAGADVCLFEREAYVGTCASGVNAGTLAPQNNPIALTSICRVSLELWSGIGDELGVDIGYRRVGGLKIAENTEQAARLRGYAEERRQAGLEVEYLEGAELRELAPYLADSVLAANYCPLDSYSDPLKSSDAFAAAAIRRGARVLTGTPVIRIERQAKSTGFVLNIADGQWRARTLLLTAGLWTKNLLEPLGVTLPTKVRINQMAVTERMPVFITHVVSHANRTLTVKQKESGSVLVGGGWPGTGDPSSAPRALPSFASTVGNIRQAVRVLPKLRHASVIRSWAGFDGRNEHQTPFLGAVPGNEGLYLATSCSGGYTIGPAVGRLMAELLTTGRSPVDISAFGLS